MVRRRWEKVQIGALTEGERDQLLTRLGALKRQEFVHLESRIGEVGSKGLAAERAGSIADPSGGTTIDVEARAAIVAILAVLRTTSFISSEGGGE